LSFDGMLVYSAEVMKRTVTGTDPDDGVEEVSFISSGTFPCWIEQRGTAVGGLRVDEHQQARDTITGEWLLVCKLGVNFDAYDRIRHDSRIFEVIGAETRPTPGGPHHIEANLRFIEG
jgi:hypothetical protein